MLARLKKIKASIAKMHATKKLDVTKEKVISF